LETVEVVALLAALLAAKVLVAVMAGATGSRCQRACKRCTAHSRTYLCTARPRTMRQQSET
jgi:hypothetical protein